MYGDNGKPFIAKLYKVILSPGLCDCLYFHYYVDEFGIYLIFHKYFYTVFFSYNEQSAVALPHSTQRKHAFLVKKRRKSENHKSKSLKVNFPWNYCIIDQDKDL